MNTQTEEPKPKRTPRTLAVREPQDPSSAMLHILEKIADKGITTENVSVLKEVTGVFERLQDKQAEKDFAQAFSQLQSEMPRVVATKPVPNKDGTVRYRFAPYEEILEQVQPYLSKHGFSVSFNSSVADGRMTATCTLRHISGHSQSNQFSVRIGQGPPGATETQADGSAKTYAKRGALSDALNIVVDHDDDARMIGEPISGKQAYELRKRVEETKSDEEAFLRYAGVDIHVPFRSMTDDDINFAYCRISSDRLDALDEILRRKEGKLI